jgi:hypothetical protein
VQVVCRSNNDQFRDRSQPKLSKDVDMSKRMSDAQWSVWLEYSQLALTGAAAAGSSDTLKYSAIVEAAPGIADAAVSELETRRSLSATAMIAKGWSA